MNVGELFVLFGLQPKGWENGTKLVEGLARATRRYLGVEAVRSMVGFVEHAAEAGTHIIALGKQFGITTRTVQEWSYVAKQSGSNIDELGVGIRMLERTLRSVHEGGGSKLARKALQDFGITSDDISKAMESPDGLNNVMFKLADRTKEMGVKMSTASGLTMFFGQRARGIAADLSQGSEAIKAQIAHLHEMGGVIDDGQLQNLKKFNNDLNDLKIALSAIGMQVVGALAPSFSAMLRDAAAWLSENRELIAGAFRVALETLAAGFRAVAAVVKFVQQVIHDAFAGDDSALAILATLAMFIGGPVVLALTEMAIATIAALSPWLLIAMAVGGLVFVIIKVADALKRGFTDAINQIGHSLKELWDDWQSLATWIESVPDKIGDAFTEAFTAIGNALKNLPVIKQLIELYNWATHNPTVAENQAEQKQRQEAYGPYQISGDPTFPTGQSGSASVNAPSGAAATNVNVAPMTVNINGVPGTKEAQQSAAEAIEKSHRQAWAAVGGAR